MSDPYNINEPNAVDKENQTPIERFRALPLPAQVALMIGAVFIIFNIFNRGGDETVQQAPEARLVNPNQVTREQEKEVFEGISTDRNALVQQWFEQNRREISDLQDTIDTQFEERDKALTSALEQNASLQREMRQMLADFTAEIRSMEASSQRDKEIISQMAQEMREIQLNSPTSAAVGGGESISPLRRQRISQTPLGFGPSGPEGQALLSGVTERGQELISGQDIDGDGQIGVDGNNVHMQEKLPFMPPLGFVKATLLNGFDALVGGQATPALARLEGQYRTAMNSTVSLDGCFALVEFQGEISTERAIGKPARMTCVYPDQGAVTYGLSGYVVDAEDGIIGVPGVFYEGDASRLAAAMAADFAAGIASIVESNQSTFTVDSSGNAQQTLTGNEFKAEIAGGVNKAIGSLSEYLLERASRVLPFVRIDNTREVHLVILSGVEFRKQGNPWTLLFDGDSDIITTEEGE